MKTQATALILLLTLALTGCMSTMKLRADLGELDTRIEGLRPRGEACAPGLLAAAEVEVAVARRHSMRGHGMVAADHITQAFVLVDEATALASHPNCSVQSESAPQIEDPPPSFPPLSADGFAFPIMPPAPLPPLPLLGGDKDGDGIPDNEDQCPLVAGIPEAQGCAPDTDGDGLADNNDKCPLEAGSPDAGGCPYRYISVGTIRIHLRGKKIHFDSGGRKIAPESFLILDEISLWLKSQPKLRLRIDGHMDSKGSTRSTKSASVKRAKTVRRYLIKSGIDGDRIITIGYGESQPIADNSTAAGREQNRRIEFHILKNGTP